ncbi:MAG: zinc-binding alcohol dehydrogenase [Roseiflexaceae bacterium]|nr:zinc-binding alcohol dehydrogenase [Roseiflexaceae bacterium]
MFHNEVIGRRAVMPSTRALAFAEFVVPAPGPSQLLVETEACAISPGTELAVYTGIHQWLADPTRAWPKFPFTPGYSAVGRVAALGSDVQGYAVGQRVIWAGRQESHALVDTQAQDRPLQRIGEHVDAAVAASTVLARFPLAALVQSGSLLGQAVAVFGLGTIGQIALRLYAAAGAYPLIGIDPVAARRQIAEHTSGVRTVDPTNGDLNTALRELNNGELPEIVVDATGAPATVHAAMAAVADGGKVVMVGSPRGVAGDVDFYWHLHGRSIQLIGAHGSAIGAAPRERFPFTLDRALRLLVYFVESGRLQLADLITQRAQPEQLQEMYEGLLHERERFLGVVIEWKP